MSYQDYFKTDIDETGKLYYKFLVSRNFSSPKDALLQTYVPPNFPTEFTVELSMFSVLGGELAYNDRFTSSTNGAFSIRTLQYSNSQIRRLLFIDLRQLINEFPIGEFLLILNFYVMEVGDISNPVLQVKRISPSRTELELELTPSASLGETYTAALSQFASPRVTSNVVLDVVNQIFNTGSTTIQLNTDNTRYSSSLLLEQLPDGLDNTATDYIIDVSQTIMSGAYNTVKNTISSDISMGKTIFTDLYLQSVITSAASMSYSQFVSATSVRNEQPIVQFVIDESE
jgi:hypothetical protein